MGFLKGIGKAFKSIGKAVGTIAKGVVKFAKSPLGKLMINVGLTFLTGGTGGLLAKGLSMLGGAGKLGSLLGTFSGVASKFLGPVQSLLSKTGLGTIAGFLGKAGGPGDLLSMAKDLFSARQAQPATDPTTDSAAKENLMRMFAQQQAQMLKVG
jgi:hypothetical protein